MNTHYFSKESFEEFKRELGELKTVRRQDVAERLKLAKEYGDLSENAEYAEAREEQERVERRIFELEEILKHAVVISERKAAASEEVGIGSTVTARKGNEVMKYHIVGSHEARPEDGKISNESPLGKAFLGHKAEDKIVVHTPGGDVAYVIVKVE